MGTRRPALTGRTTDRGADDWGIVHLRQMAWRRCEPNNAQPIRFVPRDRLLTCLVCIGLFEET